MKARVIPMFLIALIVAGWIPPSAISQPYGIDSRTTNTSLVLGDLPADTPGTMQIVRVFSQLTFTKPVLLIESPDASGRMFVVQQNGLIRAFPSSPDPAPGDVSTFLNIQDRVLDSGEQGLLGLAFDPDYASNGLFYVYYSWNGTSPGTSRVSRFHNTNPAGNSVDPATEEVVLALAQPYSNHNGGMIAFGPDDMLYIGFGDGGSAGDPQGHGQNTQTLLGSLLRIDVRSTPDSGLGYHVPVDNPFYAGGPAGSATRKEIFAYGLRNPWRFCFNPFNGDLLAGDVGQNAYEEIDHIEAGKNYGWDIMEGTHCYNSTTCDQAGLTLPLIDYGRSLGYSVTGGFVYAAGTVPELYGVYIYGDYGSGRIWGLRYDSTSVDGPYTLVSNSGVDISGFGQDKTGEVYVLNLSGGQVYVLRPLNGGGGTPFPTRLSDHPALLAVGSGIDQTALGVIPYEPIAQLWSDGALKERYLALPGFDVMGFRLAGGWDCPEGTIVVKNFLLPMDERNPVATARRIETRLLYRKENRWNGYTFEWNDAETDAQLLTGLKYKEYSIFDRNGTPTTVNYLFPSRNQCNLCHTNAANGLLGLNTPQMNCEFLFPASGIRDNQLRTYDRINLFSAPLPAPPDSLPRMPDPFDTAAPLLDRAKAYLAANCSMCHQPGGTAPTNIDLRWETPLALMNLVDVVPNNGDLGTPGARLISIHEVDQSVLIRRMVLRDGLYQMPPLASSRPDEDGLALLRAWNESLLVTSALSLWMFY